MTVSEVGQTWTAWRDVEAKLAMAREVLQKGVRAVEVSGARTNALHGWRIEARAALAALAALAAPDARDAEVARLREELGIALVELERCKALLPVRLEQYGRG